MSLYTRYPVPGTRHLQVPITGLFVRIAAMAAGGSEQLRNAMRALFKLEKIKQERSLCGLRRPRCLRVAAVKCAPCISPFSIVCKYQQYFTFFFGLPLCPLPGLPSPPFMSVVFLCATCVSHSYLRCHHRPLCGPLSSFLVL